MIGLSALFAFEANDLRGAALERRGDRLIGVARDAAAPTPSPRLEAWPPPKESRRGPPVASAPKWPRAGRAARARLDRRGRGRTGCSRKREHHDVAIIDYGSGNLHSAAKAFERAAREGARRSPSR